MKVYALIGEDGDIEFLFSTRAAAVAFGGESVYVTQHEVYDGEPLTWTYWHRGAAVYPDGFVRDWDEQHVARGEVSIPPVDDHLNQRDEPWDGHMQGHCGEHVSVFGTDPAGVEVAYLAAVARALARQTGTCQSKFGAHDGDVDGTSIYEARFSTFRRRGESTEFSMACGRHFAHDFEQHRPDLAICRRCATAQWSVTTSLNP